MSAAIIIPLAMAKERLRRRAQEKADQAAIEACEAEIQAQPHMSADELIRRVKARLSQGAPR